MNTIRTKATDLAEITAALDGKIEFSSIKFDQILIKKQGESVNDLLFIGKKFGLYFYTSRSCFDAICYLYSSMPTYVVCEDSKNVYELLK